MLPNDSHLPVILTSYVSIYVHHVIRLIGGKMAIQVFRQSIPANVYACA